MAKAKEIVGLDCDASATEGIKLILSTRLDEVCELRTSALDWSSEDGVHDMRVASRRLRSALRDFKPYLKQRKLRSAVDAIKRIADSLGAVRDNDVAILALNKLAEDTSIAVAVGIEQFAGQRRLRREKDRAALVEAIAEDQILSLRKEFTRTLETTDRLNTSLRAVGTSVIETGVNDLREISTGLYHPLETKPLHKIRISAKRLRYAIELFSNCWETELNQFAREFAEIQTSLGDLHDCDVWIVEFGAYLEKHDLRGTSAELSETDFVPSQQREASLWLLDHFTKKRTDYYRDALDRWNEWESSGFFARLEACLQIKPNLSSASKSLRFEVL
jgi:CHAD domain-containing protein